MSLPAILCAYDTIYILIDERIDFSFVVIYEKNSFVLTASLLFVEVSKW